MKVISYRDSELEQFKERISNFVETYESMGFAYWVFVLDSNPLAIFFLGKEPVNLIAPSGTLVSMIQILDYDGSEEYMAEIVSKTINMGNENKVKYILASNFPEEQIKQVNNFKQQGFKEKARWYRMERQLEDAPDPQGNLRLEIVKRTGVKEFLNASNHCTSGSYEGEATLNLAGVPENLLTFWYNMQELYYVYKDQEMIGILNLTPDAQNNLNNIGIAPEYRSKGYGKQVLLHALERLRAQDKENVSLRVHAENKRAIGLYKSSVLS